ncbi:P-loop ATPase, Sll1717 family [Burkholderia sola]|uniref:P-loop ATPase, Sll1717 family n=1 Tax=Burkholderia sola TaxID=2843302 RepID=UPI001C0A8725
MNRIHGLPDRFSLTKLSGFNFGEPDGKDDPLLEACMLPITPVVEFLEESKSIVVGDRGTGKTALFRLLTARKLEFKSTGKFAQFYVPIDEELAYKTLKEHVTSQVRDPVNTLDAPHRIVWEIFLLSRCLEALSTHFSDDKDFLSIRDGFFRILGKNSEQKLGILDLFKNTKKTVGVKLEGGHLGLVIPNFYTSIEPTTSPSSNELDENQLIDVPSIKSELNAFLKQKRCIAYLLVDKIDEFVAGDEYETQKAILQALLHCWRDYQSYPQLKPKLFLRRDLFERLDFSAIGRDKIDPKKTELKWSQEDIRQFMAVRILHNLAESLGRRSLKFQYDAESLRLDKRLLSSLDASCDHDESASTLMRSLRMLVLNIRMKLNLSRRDEYDARNTSMYDAAFKALITAIFPRKVTHLMKGGKSSTIDLTDYLSTHFHFSGGHTTPRVMLQFLNSCVAKVREYYRNNPDQSITLTEKGEYPLVLREHVSAAYEETRGICLNTLIGLSDDFKRPAMLLMQAVSRSKDSTRFSSGDVRRHIGKALAAKGDLDERLGHFLAFYEHAGLFRCVNRAQVLSQRVYELPIIFQQIRPLEI